MYQDIITYISLFFSIFGAIIIVYGGLRAIISILKVEIFKKSQEGKVHKHRAENKYFTTALLRGYLRYLIDHYPGDQQEYYSARQNLEAHRSRCDERR